MKKKYGYIYITTNLVNNKKYIGQHKAIEFDQKYKGSGKLIKEALIKYGEENFKVDLIEWCFSKEELDEKEIYGILEYDAVDDDTYYNLHEGGGSGGSYVNKCGADGVGVRKPLTEDQKKNMRKPHRISEEAKANWHTRGKKVPDEVKKKISDKLKIARSTYAPIGNIGISPSKESISKMIKTKRDNYIGCQAVKCLETGYIFKSEGDAGKGLGVTRAKISECVNGRKESTCGYHGEKFNIPIKDLNDIDYSLYEDANVSGKYIKDKLYFNETKNKYYKSYKDLCKDGYTRSDAEIIRDICINNKNTTYKNCIGKFIKISEKI